MKRLTKVVRKRKLNYKPTIGLTVENACGRGWRTGHLSFNANTYYIEARKVRLAEEERKAKIEIEKIMREVAPQMFTILDWMTERMGGFNPYFF